MTAVLPLHELTIQGSDVGKVGTCRCGGWSFIGKVSTDYVTAEFVERHLVVVGAARPGPCRRGCSGIRTLARDGSFSSLAEWATCGCRPLEVAGASVSGWSDGHPSRREDPDQPGALVAAL